MPEFQIIPPPYNPDEDEIKVAPVEAESAAEVLARLQGIRTSPSGPARDDDDNDDAPVAIERPAHTFTLKEMIIAVTALSVWMAVLRLLQMLSWPLAACATGIVTFAAAVYLWSAKQETGMTRLIWWVLFVTYLTTTLLALLSG